MTGSSQMRSLLSMFCVAGLAMSIANPADAQLRKIGNSFSQMEMDDGETDGPGGEEAGVQPKTPMGRYIQQLDFNRTPEAVLQARAKLAIQLREELLKTPEQKEKERKEAEEDAKKVAPKTDADKLAPPAPDPLATAADKLGIKLPPGLTGGVDIEGRQPTKTERRLADRYRLCVIAGDWASVAEFLKKDAGEDAAAIFGHTLLALQSDTAMVPEEVLALADVSPAELTDKQVTTLGQILRATVGRGADAGTVSLMLVQGTARLGGKEAAGRARAARLLMAADLPVEAKPFLDSIEQARERKDASLLNLHAMYFKGLSLRKKDAAEKRDAVKQSWDLCIEALSYKDGKTLDRTAALERCVEFIDEMPQDEADAWLTSLFAGDQDLAWKAIEKASQKARTNRMSSRPPDERLKGLLILNRMGKAIVSGDAAVTQRYRTALDMISMTILEEAEDSRRRRNDERFQCIPPEQIGQVLPDGKWLRAASPGLAAKLEVMSAQVTIGAGDLDAVLELIRPLAKTDKERAGKLAESLVTNWPNYVKPGSMTGEEDPYASYARKAYYPSYSSSMRYNPYAYGNYGGYEGAIPLTRAKQRRFLDQLAEILGEFKTMGLPAGTAPQLVAAFAASHSDAEVYSREDMEKVFGPLDALSIDASIELSDTMRKRLGGLWRKPKTQEENATKRNDQQVAAEVLRGYQLAQELAQRAATADPTSWKAAILKADLSFDTAEFMYGQVADLGAYAAQREAAFSGYAAATELYANQLALGKTQASSRPYFQWFSSALGASDLGFLTRQDQPSLDQIDRVLAACDALPAAQRTKHIGLFAKDVDKAVNTLAPELKVRFLTHAGRVTGDHPDAASTRKLLAYYNDLQKEVELNLSVDGPSQIGSTDPFGAQLAVWSTRAVSRESGGFSKYLMNQQWHPQTGQPVDYKDDLEKKLRETLGERFEVVSVTFHKPGVAPMGVSRDGWEQHPLAYLTLKAKDPSVDRIPPLKLDLDFSDGRGSVILPVTSSVTLVDAKGESPLQTTAGLEITQTLDDRKVEGGSVLLEVQAKGKGIIGGIKTLVDVSTLPKGLEIASTEDHGLNVAELDTTGASVVPVAERSWTVTLKPAANAGNIDFVFPAVVQKSAKVENKHYSDADIVAAAGPISLRFGGGGGSNLWWMAIGVIAVTAGAGFFVVRNRKKDVAVLAPTFTIPSDLTPVSAVGLLRRISAARDTALAGSQRVEIASEIEAIERRYFAKGAAEGESAELHATMAKWIKAATPSS